MSDGSASSFVSYVHHMLKTVPPNNQVRAQDLPTEGITFLWRTTDEDEMAYLQRLTETGLVKTLLQLLEQQGRDVYGRVASLW